jgi:hypothetical protein
METGNFPAVFTKGVETQTGINERRISAAALAWLSLPTVSVVQTARNR